MNVTVAKIKKILGDLVLVIIANIVLIFNANSKKKKKPSRI